MATNNPSNPLAILDPAQTPAHVKAAQMAGVSNIVTRAQVNTLTFPGKVWTVTVDGSKKPLTRTGQDGEEELVQTFDAVIIAYNENRGRAYYGDQPYDQNQTRAPVCWSNDGITSDPNSTERQSEKCNICTQAIKGSRQTDQGKPSVACSVHRHLAVVPRTKDLSTAPVLRLKIPQTSDWDGLNKEAQAKGMFAFSNYLNFLKARQVPFTYSLSTKIRFDNTKKYPKLWFSIGRWLTEEETAACAEIAASGLDDLLKTDFSGFGGSVARPPGITEADEEETDDDGEMVIQQPVAPKPAPAPAPAAPKSTGHSEDNRNRAPTIAPMNGKAKTAAQKKAEAAATAAAARKAAVIDDEEDAAEADAIAEGRPPMKTATPATPAPSGSAPLDQILTDWDDD